MERIMKIEKVKVTKGQQPPVAKAELLIRCPELVVGRPMTVAPAAR